MKSHLFSYTKRDGFFEANISAMLIMKSINLGLVSTFFHTNDSQERPTFYYKIYVHFFVLFDFDFCSFFSENGSFIHIDFIWMARSPKNHAKKNGVLNRTIYKLKWASLIL